MSEKLTSPFQDRVLSIPEEYDLFLGGGRGGSKSYSMALLALRYCQLYNRKARILYIRQTFKGLEDFVEITRELFGKVYGTRARYNSSNHVWKLPGGAYFEMGQMADASDYGKYQGRSFSLLMFDESGQYANPDLLDKLRSNLRGPKDMPLRVVMGANPGEAGHQWIASRYVFKSVPWVPFYEEKSKKTWIYAPSLFTDNPFIDQEAYKRELQASCPNDAELLKAWLKGDWTVARGAYFASVLDEKWCKIGRWKSPPYPVHKDYWDLFLAHDYGSSAPSITYVCAKSPGDYGQDNRYYPRDSILLLDELATNEPKSLNKGLGWTIPVLSDGIIELSQKWQMRRPEGVADDSCFAQHGHKEGSISDEFKNHGVLFVPAKKGSRKVGWEIMKRLLQDAGLPDKPGLYVSVNCEYFWQTVPFLSRDKKRTDDVDSSGPDHGADCARYGCLYQRKSGGMQKVTGF